jgi:hypothetical protein
LQLFLPFDITLQEREREGGGEISDGREKRILPPGIERDLEIGGRYHNISNTSRGDSVHVRFEILEVPALIK